MAVCKKEQIIAFHCRKENKFNAPVLLFIISDHCDEIASCRRGRGRETAEVGRPETNLKVQVS